jgi:hypothetical protein
MPKREAARKGQRRPKGDRQRKSIAGGRWRSGPHKTADRKRAVRRSDSFDRDDLGERPD